jgi:hypothetical protein
MDMKRKRLLLFTLVSIVSLQVSAEILTEQVKREKLKATQFNQSAMNEKAKLAVTGRDNPQLNYLLKLGKADPNFMTTVTQNGTTLQCSLLDIALSDNNGGIIGNLIAIELILEYSKKKGQQNLLFDNVSELLGEKPIIYAAKRNLHKSLDLLLKYGADPNTRSQDGKYAADVALEHKAITSLEKLKEAGGTTELE